MADRHGSSQRFTRRQFLQGAAGFGGMALLAGACRPAGAPAQAPTAAPTVIKEAGTQGRITFALQTADLDKSQFLLAEFTERTGIQIDPLPSPYDSLFERLRVNLSQATGAIDVASMDDPWMPLFAGQEFLQDLAPFYQKKGESGPDQDFIGPLLALGEWPPGTGLRALPWVGNVQGFAWRQDVLDELGLEVPKTWDGVLEAAQAVLDAGTQDLFGYGIRGRPGNPAMTSFLPIIRGFGVDVVDENLEPQLDTDAGMAAIQMALQLKELAPPGAENVGHDDLGRLMYTGMVAQSGDIWPDQLTQIYDPSLSKVVGQVQVGAEPAQEGVSPANMTGTWLLGIAEGSKDPDAAFELITWITAPEQQKRLLLEGNIPTTRTSIMDDGEALEKFPFLSGLKNAAAAAVPRPRTEHYPTIEEIVGRHVSAALAGQESPEEAMKLAQTETREALVRVGALE